MSVTFEQVRAALEPEEPDYPKAAQKLGPDALPHLELLIVGDHPMMASKAAYLAGIIGTELSVPVIERAARSGDARVRIAAAAAVQNLPTESASDLLLSLVDDPDVGVQKTALRSVPSNPSAVLRARVEGLSSASSPSFVRNLSLEALARAPQSESVSAERPRAAVATAGARGGGAKGGARRVGAGAKGAAKKRTGGGKKSSRSRKAGKKR